MSDAAAGRNFQRRPAFSLQAKVPREFGKNNMLDNATMERLEKDVTSVKNDISALTGQVTDALNAFTNIARKQARHGYKQARATAEGAVGEMSERGSAVMDAAQDAATTIEETLEDAIVQRPLAAIGLAIGLGFLIGVTWRR
jgi:ElaB/YqjD/DUF883 family membrane-anchored ribosome-binding protein